MTDIPRRLRRFYREGDDSTGSNVVESNRSDKEVPSVASSMAAQEIKNKSKNEVIALTMHEIRRFMKTNNRTPEPDEQEEIADNLFNQLKTDIKEEKSGSVSQRALDRSKRLDKKEDKVTEVSASVPVEKKQSTSLSDLDFSNLLSDNSSKSGSKNISDLDLDLSELENTGSANPNENVLVEQETPAGNCPHCSRKTDSPVYCPNCGNAFCPNCAKQANSQGDKIAYTCPTCNHSFTTRKH